MLPDKMISRESIMKMDVNFVFDKDRYNFRIGVLMCCGDKILLTKFDDNDFWNLPGGRVKLGESTFDGLKRELLEEFGYVLDVPAELKVIAENFFELKQKNVHEMLFVYKICLSSEYLKKFENFKILDGKCERAHWFNKSQIQALTCKPEIIKSFYDLPDGISHYISGHKI